MAIKNQICLAVVLSLTGAQAFCQEVRVTPSNVPTAPAIKTIILPSPFPQKKLNNNKPVVAHKQSPYSQNYQGAARKPVIKPVTVVLPPADPIVSGTVKLQPFTKVVVQGPFNVNLAAQSQKPDVRYIGHRNYVKRILIRVSKDTLYLTLPSNPKEIPSVDRAMLTIHAGQVQSLQYAGSGRFAATNLNAPYLQVYLQNQGPVELRGSRMPLQHLEIAGTGPVTIKEIDSPNLSMKITGSSTLDLHGRATLDELIYAGRCKVNLATINSPHLRIMGYGNSTLNLIGHVDTLEAQLYGQSRMDAHLVVARKAYIKTFDGARADIQVTDYQNTLASDHSNIFYYRKARHHGDYMHHSGAVLQFDDLENG